MPLRRPLTFTPLIPWLCALSGCAAGASAPPPAAPGVVVTVSVEAPGLSSVEVESQVTVPIERTAADAKGLRRTRSASYAGRSIVWFEFPAKTDRRTAAQALADRIARAMPDLPPAAAVPAIFPYERTGERLLICLHAPPDAAKPAREALADLVASAEEVIRPKLATVAGVDDVTVIGGARRRLQISADSARLAAHDITPAELAHALRTDNGLLRRAPFAGAEAVGNVVVAQRNGVPVRVRDVARVEWGVSGEEGPPSGLVPAVLIAVHRTAESDPIRTNRDLIAALDAIRPIPPADWKFERKVPETAKPLAAKAVAQIESELPPDSAIELRTDPSWGDVLTAAPRANVIVKATGAEPDRVRASADDVRVLAAKQAGAGECSVAPRPAAPVIRVRVDRRRAAELAVDSAAVAETIRIAAGELEVGRVAFAGQSFPVVLGLGNNARSDLGAALKTPLRMRTGTVVTLGQVAAASEEAEPETVYREDGRSAAYVFCNFQGPAAAAADNLRRALEAFEQAGRRPIGVRWEVVEGR